MAHWTTNNTEAFVSRITFDFIAQLENKRETSGATQAELAGRMGVSDGEVSQVMNLARPNLNLKTMVKYAQALGMKVAVVAYDDNDPHNERGPVGSEVFSVAWESVGKPRDSWSVNEHIQMVTTTYAMAGYLYGSLRWWNGRINSTAMTASVSDAPLPISISIAPAGRSFANAGD